MSTDKYRQPSYLEGIAFGEDEEEVQAHFEERAKERRKLHAEAKLLDDKRIYPRSVLSKSERSQYDKEKRPPLLFPTLRHYDKGNFSHDLLAGIIIAALSLPISIGYAQVAGLPPEYGLYGSILPLLVFAIFSTSSRLVFGVDAAPAALTATTVLACGLALGTDDVVAVVPWVTFFTALFLLFFVLIRADRFVNYISAPVMGGFVSGIATSVILGQIPKLMGGTPASGELYESVVNLIETFSAGINLPSLVLGLTTIVGILTARRYVPRIPMPIFVLIIGGCLTVTLHLEDYGVALLGSVPAGLPELQMLQIPDISLFTEIIAGAFTIALVIAAETLLVDSTFAMKCGYRSDNNRELLAYSLGNAAACAMGVCPVSGSASRTAASDQFGGKTQLSAVVAALCLLIVLLFATDLLQYLPIPVLTGIVICALWSVVEVHFARRLYNAQRSEFWIFMLSFCGVLIAGPIVGVGIGFVLSFVAILLRTMNPYRAYLGVVTGRRGLFDLDRVPEARPLPFTVIYRFTGNMFFANATTAMNDVELAVNERTRMVIIELAGLTNCDISAADRLAALFRELSSKGIRLYVVGMLDRVKDQMERFGIEEITHDGVLQDSVEHALQDAFARGFVEHDGARAVNGEELHFDEAIRDDC